MTRDLARPADEEKTDDQLIGAFARGDRRAFDRLYARYRQPLFGYLYGHCGDEETAGEMFQDVWVRVISASARFDQRGRFRPYLFTLAHNRLVDFYRQRDRRPTTPLEDDPADVTAGPARRTRDAETDSAIGIAVRALPLEQREAFLLREEQGFSAREIAEVQGVEPEAAKSRLRYAYQKLRVALEEHKR